MGLNSRTKSMAARVCALAKSPKSLQMDFTSQLPVTSGQSTVWQNHGHDAGPEHCYAPTPVASMSKWISGSYASCRGKNLSCSTTHSTGCTYKSRGMLVGGVQTVAAIAKPAGKGAKGTPPRREVISAPFGTRRCQNGVSPKSVKCCVIVCCVQGPCETGKTLDLS